MTVALLLKQPLDVLFAATPLAFGPLAQVSVPTPPLVGGHLFVGCVARRRHLRITLVRAWREFIPEHRGSAP